MRTDHIEVFLNNTALRTCNEEEAKIKELLFQLGITSKYTGFFFTSCAVILSLRQPERLLLITKWLYPDVAKQFNTDWRNVERGIRSVVEIAWELCPEKLSRIAMRELNRRPSNSQFISILTHYIANSSSREPLTEFHRSTKNGARENEKTE